MNGERPLMIVLDDWEGRIAQNSCWSQLKEFVDIQFLKKPVGQTPDSILARASFLMAIRERTALTKEIFDRLPNLKLILQTGGHAYHIDQEAAKKRNIGIALGRHVKAPLNSVPELTFAMMLGVIHLLPQAQQAMHEGQWPLLTGRTLNGRRLGILGMGRHGTRVANIAKSAFNMNVAAWARPGNNARTTDNFPRLSLDELLSTSDIVTIHLKLSSESTNLINAERIKMLKQGAILINTSRGAMVDEAALINALQSGHLAGAGLDVFAKEPLPADSPLRMMNNVIITPHIGWTVEEVFDEFSQIASAQLKQYLVGELPEGELLSYLS